MEKDDRIIWDSKSGYDIGYFVSNVCGQYMHCSVRLISGKYNHPSNEFLNHEVIPYTDGNLNKMADKYGYEYRFEDYE